MALAVLLMLSATAVLFLSARRMVETRRLSAEVTRLREELYRARVMADRCRGSLLTSESSLLTLTGVIDSMRIRVDSFEALGRGRVPADRYDEYLGVFEAYNDSVAVWEIRSERLRAAETSCRTAIEHHNSVSDSIQTVLREAGVASTDP